MMKHTKEDLIKIVALQLKVSRKTTREVLDAAFDVIGDLEPGDSLAVHGFGRFSAEMTKARTVRNPATGETMQTTPRRRLTFKESKPRK
jgi:DNA-binding protein HU-beta